jgi:hypothetical protein
LLEDEIGHGLLHLLGEGDCSAKLLILKGKCGTVGVWGTDSGETAADDSSHWSYLRYLLIGIAFDFFYQLKRYFHIFIMLDRTC